MTGHRQRSRGVVLVTALALCILPVMGPASAVAPAADVELESALERANVTGSLLGSPEVTASAIALVLDEYGPVQTSASAEDRISLIGDHDHVEEGSPGLDHALDVGESSMGGVPVEEGIPAPETPVDSEPLAVLGTPGGEAPPVPTESSAQPAPEPSFALVEPVDPTAPQSSVEVAVPQQKAGVTYVYGGTPGENIPWGGAGSLGAAPVAPTGPGGALSGLNVSPEGKVCPVPGAKFTDTFGAPRSGGRSHQGADMFADVGMPIVAVQDAVINKADPVDAGTSDLGGITITYTTITGDRWYNAHLVSLAPGMAKGVSVKRGDIVGYVGKTGNARTTPPHNHIELHPGGGSAVNPTPLLNSLCK